MSTFSEWKKHTKLISYRYCRLMSYDEVEQACQAAYKAGERQGRKDVNIIANALDDAADGTDKHWICSGCATSLHNMAKDLRNK